MALLPLVGTGQVVALLPVAAVVIAPAANLNAGDVGIALKAWRAVTYGRVELHFAQCPVPTNGTLARVNAVLVLACFRQWAIIVNQTLILETFNMWISSPLAWTFADWPVTHRLTDGTSSTGSLGLARIDALVLDAGTVVRALLVKVTLALFDWLARGKGISFSASRTGACRSMVGD